MGASWEKKKKEKEDDLLLVLNADFGSMHACNFHLEIHGVIFGRL